MRTDDKTLTADATGSTLAWAKKLQSIAQTGLAYARDHYDLERYRTIQEIATEMMAAIFTGVSRIQLADSFTREIGYATPKIEVRAAVFSDGSLLLVRERADGCWSLPGGWADIGDSPSIAAVREVKEESGYDVVVCKLAAVFDRDDPRHGHPPIPYHAYKMFFTCEVVGGAAAISHETDAVSFFAQDSIPPLSLERVTPQQIKQLFEHHRNPELPTSFD
jgi:ADP-ribose pyrophosphatase YjhB (NUDIX family)